MKEIYYLLAKKINSTHIIILIPHIHIICIGSKINTNKKMKMSRMSIKTRSVIQIYIRGVLTELINRKHDIKTNCDKRYISFSFSV